MSAQEFDEWWSYFQVEPFGEERADLRMGIIASTLANINRDAKARPEPYRPLDFMPYSEKPTANQLMRDRLRGAFVVRKKSG